MTKKELKKFAYKQYQLDWMRTHGYSIDDIIKELNNIYQECEDTEDRCPQKLYDEFEEEYGFRGSLWVCFDEFCGAEFLDNNYMEHILTSIFDRVHVDAWKTYCRYYINDRIETYSPGNISANDFFKIS